MGEISIEINSEKKIIDIRTRTKYTNEGYDITIIEIIPEKDYIYNFLELDKNIFFENDIYKKSNIYILQKSPFDNYSYTSYGTIKNKGRNNNNILYLCSTSESSGGAPIMNLKNLKVIGIHRKYNLISKCNMGTLLKLPISEFINKYKDHIERYIESPKAFSFGSNENKINDEFNINNFNKVSELENALKKEKEKNRELQEQINKLNILLKNNNINNYKDLNKDNQDDLIKSVLKKIRK